MVVGTLGSLVTLSRRPSPIPPTPSTRLAHVCHSLRPSAASRDEWREPKGTVTRRREAGEWRVTDVERGPSHYVHPAPLTSLSLRRERNGEHSEPVPNDGGNER